MANLSSRTFSAAIKHLSDGDTITISGTPYDGFYASEYIESLDFQGYKPVFTLASGVSGATRNASVTSDIAGITDQPFTIATIQNMRDGTMKLILQEA